MSLQVIADEIHFEGHLVALLACEGLPDSVKSQFRADLECGTLFKEDAEEQRAEAVAEFLRRAKQLASGGLLRYAALQLLAQEMEGEFG